MAIAPEDDGVRPRGEGEHFMENYLFAGLADDSDIGFYFHVARAFEVDLLELHAATFVGEDVVSCLERHVLDPDDMRTGSFTYEIVEPLREWRLTYRASGRPGAFVDRPHREQRLLGFDIRLRAELPPTDLAAAFGEMGFTGMKGHRHYEQGFVWEGDITVGDRTFPERGLGLRDHSWGRRFMTAHNTTWWFPAVGPGARTFYTGIEINGASGHRMAVATRADADGVRTFDDLDVTMLDGDQVSFSSVQLRYGDEAPAVGRGVCRIPVPWLVGRGLPRLSDDVICRATLPDGSQGIAVAEMSRAATDAEQAGFAPTVDTWSSGAVNGSPGPVDVRDLGPRLRGLARQFPVDWSQFYMRTVPGHVERAVIASLLVDLGPATGIDLDTAARYRSVLSEGRALLVAHDLPESERSVDRALAGAAPLADLRALATAVVAALPPIGSAAATPDVERLRRSLVEVEVSAGRRYAAACRELLHGGPDAHPPPSGTPPPDGLLAAVDAAVADRFGEAAAGVRGRVTPGGLSKLTVTYDLHTGPVVVRADRGAEYGGATVADEYRSIAAAHAAGVPAPTPVACLDARDGRPALSVVTRLDGVPSVAVPRFRDAAMCRQLGTILARIHRIPLTAAPHLPGQGGHVVARVHADLDRRERQWRAADCPNPFTEYVFQWLRAHADDADGPAVFVHGDYRPHNMLTVDGRISAVLDWEHAKVGNAAEDLGYVRPTVEALASWETFLSAYVGAGGRAPSDREMTFYDVYSALAGASIHDQMEVEFARGGDQPLAMIATVLQQRPVMRDRVLATMGDVGG